MSLIAVSQQTNGLMWIGFPKLRTLKWNTDTSRSDDAFPHNASKRQKRQWMMANRDLYMTAVIMLFTACPDMVHIEWWIQYNGAYWNAKASEREVVGIVPRSSVNLTLLGISG